MTTEMQAFVSTFGLYNSGRIVGRWFAAYELADEDAVMEELRAKALEAGVPEGDLDDTVGEEFMIQDYEGFPVPVSESQSPSSLAEIADACEDRETYLRVRLYVEACGAHGMSFEDIVSASEDMMVIQGDNLQDAVHNYLNDSGMLADLPKWAANYFDYESYGRDMTYDGWTEVRMDGDFYLVYTN